MRECTEQDQIVSSAAYILFYARRNIAFDQLDYERIRNRLDVVETQGSSSYEAAVKSPPVGPEDQEMMTMPAGVPPVDSVPVDPTPVPAAVEVKAIARPDE